MCATAVSFLLLLSAALTAPGPGAPPALDAFADGAKHYRDGSAQESYTQLAETDWQGIAENILRYQRANGGWPSNWDPRRVLAPAELEELASAQGKDDTTFDNRATYPQIAYLADAFTRSGDARFRDAAERGLRFMLAAQHPCGGFPHSWPSTANYRPYITFMDDVTAGALGLLQRAASGAAPFAWVDPPLRAELRAAADRGTACVLRLQLPWQGRPGVWAGQYDPERLVPVQARSFELPSFVSSESVGVVEYLMGLPPTPEIVAAIEGALAWFRTAAITGQRLERVPIDPVRFDHHTARFDVRLVPDPAAPPLWARFYELDTLRPFMANRDGIKVYALEEVQLERRTGYGWYGNYAARLLERAYPAWRKAHGLGEG